MPDNFFFDGNWGTLPTYVRQDHSISFQARVLYAELWARSTAERGCTETNATLASLYGVTDRTVQRWIRELKRAGHITVSVDRNFDNEVLCRHIFLTGR